MIAFDGDDGDSRFLQTLSPDSKVLAIAEVGPVIHFRDVTTGKPVGRPLEIGEPANLTVVDPDATWTVTGPDLASRSANTPYESMTLPATVTATLLRGKVTARDGKSPA